MTRFLDLNSLSIEQKAQIDLITKDNSSESKSYMDHLNDLRSSSIELNGMTEPDVDLVAPLVEKGLKGFKGCKERIEQVEAYVNELNNNDLINDMD